MRKMLELVFQDSTTGMLKQAMTLGDCKVIAGVRMEFSEDGTVIREEAFTPEPYTGPKLEGTAEDVLGIWLIADIGDISDMDGDWQGRLDLWHTINKGYEEFGESDWVEAYSKTLKEFLARLKSEAANARPIRIWWSDTPGEYGGFCWAMSLLAGCPSPVYSVKLPDFVITEQGCTKTETTSSLPIELLPQLAAEAQLVEAWQRQAYADEWQRLVEENAPLRALVNGRLLSVEEDFYDGFLWRQMPEGEFRVAEAIGRALVWGPAGLSDWWYAKRMRQFLKEGRLEMVKDVGRFYHCIVRRR